MTAAVRQRSAKLQRLTSSGAELEKTAISRELSEAQLRAIDGLLRALKFDGTKLKDITKARFSHPGLDSGLAEIYREMRMGRGAVVLKGIPVDKYELTEIEMAYVGLGCHFGIPVSQNLNGDIIGHVTDKKTGTYGKKTEQGDVLLRGYQSSSELELHSDSADIVFLLCIRGAKSGGLSSIADALKVYEILESEFPKDLSLLMKGWPAHRRNEQAPGEAKVTPYDVPTFGWKDGLLSCRKNSIAAHETALEALGRGPLDPESVAALQRFEAVAARADVRSDMQLEPGDILILNNFEFLHARTEYEDWEDPLKKRLLLRLWLEFDPPRPIDRHMLTFHNASGFKGIDERPDRHR
jgi:alpha-ketoglutarate-dependent taurine dioxygenase